MKEAGSGHEDSSDNMLTLDALQVSSSFQVTLELSCPVRTPVGEIYMPTYKARPHCPRGLDWMPAMAAAIQDPSRRYCILNTLLLSPEGLDMCTGGTKCPPEGRSGMQTMWAYVPWTAWTAGAKDLCYSLTS
jgi:hypothetical protein